MPFLVHRSTVESPSWPEVSDRDLLGAIQAGKEAAFDELISRKTKPLLQLVTRILGDREEARDVVQVTFLRVWENRSRFDRRWSPNTWIYRIASNLAIDELRSRKVRERSLQPAGVFLRAIAGGRETSLAELEDREIETIFQRLAESLTEKQRLAFVLRGHEGLSSEEVGKILGCRPSTVRNHLLAARRKMRHELRRLYPEYSPSGSHAGDDRGGN